MESIKTELDGVYIIKPKVFGDHRGWFTETYSKKKFDKLDYSNFDGFYVDWIDKDDIKQFIKDLMIETLDELKMKEPIFGGSGMVADSSGQVGSEDFHFGYTKAVRGINPKIEDIKKRYEE